MNEGFSVDQTKKSLSKNVHYSNMITFAEAFHIRIITYYSRFEMTNYSYGFTEVEKVKKYG